MPNEVFLRTRAGLSTMVSSRAAERILEGALHGSGHDPDDVNQSQMRTALLGPVLQELENVLPRVGLKRNLERLAKSLRDAPTGDKEKARALLTGTIPADVAPIDELVGIERHLNDRNGVASDDRIDDRIHEREDRPVDQQGAVAADGSPEEVPATSAATDPELTEASRDESPAAPVPAGPFDAFAGHPVDAQDTTVKPGNGEVRRVTPRLLRRLDDDELEEKVTRFALIDHVQLVAAVRADGSIPVSRGEGLDLELLSRLSRLTLSLLAKGGALRSLHLGHSLGQLFLFPIGPHLLIVLGSTDLNLGSVTTAFTALALEEEL